MIDKEAQGSAAHTCLWDIQDGGPTGTEELQKDGLTQFSACWVTQLLGLLGLHIPNRDHKNAS